MKIIILIAFLGLALQACSSTRRAQYEYSVLSDSDLISEENGTTTGSAMTKALNNRATGGWRLISAVSSSDEIQTEAVRRVIGGPPPFPSAWTVETHFVFIFERPLAPVESSVYSTNIS